MKRILIAIMITAVLLVTCKSLPDLSRFEPGSSLTSGDFLLEVTDGEKGRGAAIVSWT
jgi:hypothetical protein